MSYDLAGIFFLKVYFIFGEFLKVLLLCGQGGVFTRTSSIFFLKFNLAVYVEMPLVTGVETQDLEVVTDCAGVWIYMKAERDREMQLLC